VKKQLYISEGSRPLEVKQMFSQWYPFLKMELYRTDARQEGRQKKAEPVTEKFGRLSLEGFVDVDDDITVAELIDRLACFGLRTEIFRKSGTVWVETKLTDNWTLEQQNNAGEEITNHV